MPTCTGMQMMGILERLPQPSKVAFVIFKGAYFGLHISFKVHQAALVVNSRHISKSRKYRES